MRLIITISDHMVLSSLTAMFPKPSEHADRNKVKDYILDHDEIAISEECLREFGGDLLSGITCLALFAASVALDLKY